MAFAEDPVERSVTLQGVFEVKLWAVEAVVRIPAAVRAALAMHLAIRDMPEVVHGYRMGGMLGTLLEIARENEGYLSELADIVRASRSGTHILLHPAVATADIAQEEAPRIAGGGQGV